LPEIVTGVLVATGVVIMLKLAEELPAGIVTVPARGTCATSVLPLCRLTVAPPVGAAPFNLTVPVEVFPPTTVAGFRVSDCSDAALIVKLVWMVVLP
jgi:hypothetical protein